MEEWKDIPGFNSYQVSNLGNIRTIGRMVVNKGQFERKISARNLAPMNNGRGYLAASIQIKGQGKKNLYIHRLVASLFIPNPDNLPEVNHIDGDKSNNNISNLEWVSTQQNRDHAVRTGLIRRGERIHSSKLTADQVLLIYDTVIKNPSINKSELGRKYGINCTTVIKIQRKQRWKHLFV